MLPARPVEQLGAQLPLQRADLLGQRGLRDVHALGGPGEVPGVGDGDEVAELLELHTPAIEPHRRCLWKCSRIMSWTDRWIVPYRRISWQLRQSARHADRTARPSLARALLWRSTIGKKTVMAVSGLIMLLYLVVHMLGNLKIFFGADEFNGYAHWLRTIGEPLLHHEWFLWIVRVGAGGRGGRARRLRVPAQPPRPGRAPGPRTCTSAGARATRPAPCAGAGSSSACSSSGTCST